jgi:hypothetical protein
MNLPPLPPKNKLPPLPISSPSKLPSKLPISSPSKLPSKLPISSPSKLSSKLPPLTTSKLPSKLPISSPSKLSSKLPPLTASKSPSKLPPLTALKSPSKLPPLTALKSPSKLPPLNTPKSPSKLPPLTALKSPSKLPLSNPLIPLRKGLTNVKDVDLIILSKLNDKDLESFCLTNKAAAKLCKDDNFWINRIIEKYGKDALKYKPENKTWRQYYSNIYYLAIRTGHEDNILLKNKISYDELRIDDMNKLREIKVVNPKINEYIKNKLVLINIKSPYQKNFMYFFREENKDQKNFKLLLEEQIPTSVIFRVDNESDILNYVQWLKDLNYCEIYDEQNYNTDEIYKYGDIKISVLRLDPETRFREY